MEHFGKAWAVAKGAARQRQLLAVFPADRVSSYCKVLGACTYGTPRRLTREEEARLDSCTRTLRLLQCVRMGLRTFLGAARTFCLSKANFGWVGRAPTWTAAHKLFTATFVGSCQVREPLG